MHVLLCHIMQGGKTNLWCPVYKLTHAQVDEARLTSTGHICVTNKVC